MRSLLFLFTVAVLLAGASHAAEPVLKKGHRLAIIGDSITEQKLYSKYIETYLQVCYPQLEIQCFQFGWSGERAPGFANRMENDLVPWKPDVVTTCYGMNDGSYRAYNEQIGKTYEIGMRQIVDRTKSKPSTSDGSPRQFEVAASVAAAAISASSVRTGQAGVPVENARQAQSRTTGTSQARRTLRLDVPSP